MTTSVTTQIVHDVEHVRIKYMPEIKLLMFVWKGAVNSEQYKDTFLRGLKFADDHEIDYFLSDIRLQKIVGPRERKWFEDVALPMAVERGLKKGGSIFDGNIFKEYYLNNILLKTRKFKLPFKFFKNEEDALNWMLEKEE